MGHRAARPPPESETALVVGGTDYGEADRIVKLLTPRYGHVSALARRARSSRHRFGGALDIGNRIDAAIRPRNTGLWHLERADLLDGRVALRKDLDRLLMLTYACELCAALAQSMHPEPQLFGLLEMAATLLDGMTTPPSPRFRLGLEAKALTFAGLTPVLDRCSTCDGPLAEPMVFLPASGGSVHLGCVPGGGDAVSTEWLVAVEQARRTPLRASIDAPLPPGPPWILASAVEAHIGRALRTRSVLAALCQPG